MLCVGVAGPDVANTKICCGFLLNGFLSSGRRQYCGFLLRDLRVILLINLGGPHLFNRRWTPKHSCAPLSL